MDHKDLHKDLSNILEILRPTIEDKSKEITPSQARSIDMYLRGASKLLVNTKLQFKAIDIGWNVDVPLMNMTANEAFDLKKKAQNQE